MWNPIEKIRTGWHSVVGELKKCTWPTVPELRESTVVVVVTVLILTVWVAAADQVCGRLIRLLTTR
jgi:preprotein translocase subunit SecE